MDDPRPPSSDASAATAPSVRAERARQYEAIHNRLLGARILITAVLLTLYLFTGASAELAAGLASRFGDHWWWTNVVYLLITFFAFSALMFPFSWFSDFYLEHRYGLSHQSLNSWLSDYAKGLALELILTTAFLSAIYALLRFWPAWWWAWATVVYVGLSVVLSSIWPVWIMPLFHSFEPLESSDFTEAVEAFVEREGLDVLGVYRWGLEEKTETANAALTGIGKTRRIILSDTMIERYSREEIIAVLAHEVGHFKHKDMWRMIAVGTALAAAGFFVAHLVLTALVSQLGFAQVADIGAFPIFIFALFVFSLISMPLSNGHSRRREYAADAYAVQATGTADHLTQALTKLADQNLADQDPPAWIEWLLHSHPSIKRRVHRAQQIPA